MKKIIFLFITVFLGGFVACTDLDIPPKNILFDEDIYNPDGMEAYMAGMYRMLPMDDYNVTNGGKEGFFGGWECFRWPMISTGETVNRHEKGLFLHTAGYWSEGWKIIRNANNLIENLPAYRDEIKEADEWIAEAKFIRAYVYFTMAKRYGGLPIIEGVQAFDPDFSTLYVARSSCKDTYDFILNDLQSAYEGMSKRKLTGRANTYVALALKSKVALFAASIAKYGESYIYSNDGLMLCGIPTGEANKYYEISWEASRSLEGIYSLVGEGVSDPAEQEKNFEKIFTNADASDESIFIRKYAEGFYVHSFDLVYVSPRMVTDGGDRYGVTLDWMELFDGQNPTTGRKFVNPATGKLNVLNPDGTYYVYGSPTELYEGVEPRLRASILVPGNTYKGAFMDFRRGIVKETIDPSTPIQKITVDDYVVQNGFDNAIQPGRQFFLDNIIQQTSSARPGQQGPADIYTVPGSNVKIYRGGLEGPPRSGDRAALTGINGRKWLNLDLPVAAVEANRSSQSWIDIRYAEILLNRAEAALELAQNGVASISYGGGQQNLRSDAFSCINRIRQRAGANLLNNENELSTDPAFNRTTNANGLSSNPGPGGFVVAPNRGLQIIRVERYKELAFEHKLYWDLRRWFTFHIQINHYKRRGLYPFIFATGATTIFDGQNKEVPLGKFIYDTKVCEAATNELNFNANGSGVQNYYEYIPTAEMKKNPLLQGNRGQ
ncbi:MAG: RagB/SusD family nutrient uptake outer membrane protein [Tannerella sp.]|jgi:hypothetical protein|nr:RagB/SusD family nutrient uptake outer membrane protein [Tannerella sp.]